MFPAPAAKELPVKTFALLLKTCRLLTFVWNTAGAAAPLGRAGMPIRRMLAPNESIEA